MVYFTIYPTTRLGNWLFQYAAALSTKKPVGAYLSDESLVPQVEPFKWMFGGIPFVRELPEGCVTYVDPGWTYSKIPDEVLSNKDVQLKGYYLSEKYFDCELVRQRLAPAPDRVAALRVRYGEILAVPHVTGIHVRRGDYLAIPHVHPFVGCYFFRDCLAQLPEVTDFIVCSDDIAWCKEFFPNAFPGRQFHFSDNKTAVDDMYLLSLCQNNIISNSTFGWWGAWLNGYKDKKVFAPSMWYGLIPKLQKKNWGDIYSHEMKIVQNGYEFSAWCCAWVHVLGVWIKAVLRKMGVLR